MCNNLYIACVRMDLMLCLLCLCIFVCIMCVCASDVVSIMCVCIKRYILYVSCVHYVCMCSSCCV